MTTPAESTTPKAENDLLALIQLLWRYKYVIIASSTICAGIAVYLALTATPMYRAETTVTEVDNQQLGASLVNQIGGLASLVGMNMGNFGGQSREIKALLQSRVLAEQFLVRNKLIDKLYLDVQPRPTLWMAVRDFREGVLSIHEDKRSGLTQVSVTWKDPATAAMLANQFVALANEMMRARAIAESQASVDYLNKQMAKTDELEVRRVMYNLIESETKKLMLANVKAEYALTVVDPAVAPEVRFSPAPRTLMVLFGVFIGGLLGVIGVFARHLAGRMRASAAAS